MPRPAARSSASAVKDSSKVPSSRTGLVPVAITCAAVDGMGRHQPHHHGYTGWRVTFQRAWPAATGRPK